MASNSETGHAINIANGKKLTDIITGLSGYSPTNPKLVLGTMQTQQTTDDGLQQTVNTQNGVFQPLQNARVLEFLPIKKLARRVRSAAKSSGADAQWNKDVNAVIRKILGERLSKATPLRRSRRNQRLTAKFRQPDRSF